MYASQSVSLTQGASRESPNQSVLSKVVTLNVECLELHHAAELDENRE